MKGVEQEKLAVKQVLFESIQSTLPLMIDLFKAYGSENGECLNVRSIYPRSFSDEAMLEEIMEFFLILFGSLRKQLGLENARHIIGSFLQIFDNRSVEEMIVRNEIASIEVITK